MRIFLMWAAFIAGFLFFPAADANTVAGLDGKTIWTAGGSGVLVLYIICTDKRRITKLEKDRDKTYELVTLVTATLRDLSDTIEVAVKNSEREQEAIQRLILAFVKNDKKFLSMETKVLEIVRSATGGS